MNKPARIVDFFGRVYIHTPYDPDFVSRLKLLFGRRWHPMTQEWSWTSSNYDMVYNLLSDYGFLINPPNPDHYLNLDWKIYSLINEEAYTDDLLDEVEDERDFPYITVAAIRSNNYDIHRFLKWIIDNDMINVTLSYAPGTSILVSNIIEHLYEDVGLTVQQYKSITRMIPHTPYNLVQQYEPILPFDEDPIIRWLESKHDKNINRILEEV